MGTINTLYNLLQIDRKIEDTHIRFLYLKDVWGLEQSVIGELEGFSQSYISKELRAARAYVSRETFIQATENLFTSDEIKFIHQLPREILPDMVCIAFIENLLGIKPVHPFFDFYDTSDNVRIAALAYLGIQQTRLVQIFKKNQTTISMIVKRSMDRVLEMERLNRYEQTMDYRFEIVPQQYTFKLAGGINQ